MQGFLDAVTGIANEDVYKRQTLHFTGAPTHASTPELGRNPAAAISELVFALPGFTQPARHRGMVLATVCLLYTSDVYKRQL